MPPESIKLLLDEHYPGWLASELSRNGIDTQAVVMRADLQAEDDTTVLRTATAEARIVVTEDVATFRIAITAVPDHAGVIFCHHARFPRNRPGLARLREALVNFVDQPPEGLECSSFVWWLAGP
ncbi:MAG: DUF5615 family PIN-like protein [Actinomycetia bacterium]|nr:DUF5615 family PIN-like protein [Actinomycetes bacterium]